MALTVNKGQDEIQVKTYGINSRLIKVSIIDPLNKAPTFDLTPDEAKALANELREYARIAEVKWPEYKVEDWDLLSQWINNKNGLTYSLQEKGVVDYLFKNARGDSIYTPKSECAKTWRPT